MAIPFTRSMRALHTDRSVFTLGGLGVAIGLLMAWAAWFFLAQMAVYTTGHIVMATREGTLIAAFPPAVRHTLRHGQDALVHLQGAPPGQPRTLQAIIRDIQDKTHNEQVYVELYVPEGVTVWRADPTSVHGDVDIIVGHRSPATLVMRHWAVL